MRLRNFFDFWKSFLGILSVVAPIICLIDCVVLPIVALLLPVCGLKQFGVDHTIVTGVVLALCLPVLLWGCIKHRNRKVCLLFAAAFTLLILSEILENSIDKVGQFILACIVSFLLIRANYLNRRLLACSCAHGHR